MSDDASTDELAGGEVLVRRDGAVWHVVLNRPEARNAFTDPMYEALGALCAELRESPQVRAVVFRGAGEKAFSAGNDIGAFLRLTTGESIAAYEEWIRGTLRDVAMLPQVTIAAIGGACVGAGISLATHCDVRIATPGSRFGYPIAKTLGNALSAEVVQRTMSVFGRSMTTEMLLTGRLVTAERAYAAGALHQLVATEDLDAVADALAAEVAAAAPLTQVISKLTLDALLHGDVDPAVDRAHLVTVYDSRDFRGAVDAFVARGKAEFRGHHEAADLMARERRR